MGEEDGNRGFVGDVRLEEVIKAARLPDGYVSAFHTLEIADMSILQKKSLDAYLLNTVQMKKGHILRFVSEVRAIEKRISEAKKKQELRPALSPAKQKPKRQVPPVVRRRDRKEHKDRRRRVRQERPDRSLNWFEKSALSFASFAAAKLASMPFQYVHTALQCEAELVRLGYLQSPHPSSFRLLFNTVVYFGVQGLFWGFGLELARHLFIRAIKRWIIPKRPGESSLYFFARNMLPNVISYPFEVMKTHYMLDVVAISALRASMDSTSSFHISRVSGAEPSNSDCILAPLSTFWFSPSPDLPTHLSMPSSASSSAARSPLGASSSVASASSGRGPPDEVSLDLVPHGPDRSDVASLKQLSRRVQFLGRYSNDCFHAIREIIDQGGVKSLFASVGLHSIVQIIHWYWLNKFIRWCIGPNIQRRRADAFLVHLQSTLLLYPLDTIRKRMIVATNTSAMYSSTALAVREIFREKGAPYRGYPWFLLKAVTTATIQVMFELVVRPWYIRLRMRQRP